MTIKTQIAEHAAEFVPVGVALLLAAVFVGLTLLLAFWGKRRKARRLRKAKRRHKWNWHYFWAAVIFIAFGAFFLYLGFDDR